jgi:hypothetical protein
MFNYRAELKRHVLLQRKSQLTPVHSNHITQLGNRSRLIIRLSGRLLCNRNRLVSCAGISGSERDACLGNTRGDQFGFVLKT